MISRPQRYTSGPPRCKSERVVLLLLLLLLAAALLIISRLSVAVLVTNQTVQTLKKENDALRRNLSEIVTVTCSTPTCKRCPTCPPPPEIKNETFLKCEAGWKLHGRNCYRFSTYKLSWKDSRSFCMDLGGDLLKIDSREEQIFLEIEIKGEKKQPEDVFWIGLSDSEEEGRWLWVDGSALNQSLQFWQKGEPNNWSQGNLAGEDCVRMEKKKNAEDMNSWDDHSCDVAQRSICEKAAQVFHL